MTRAAGCLTLLLAAAAPAAAAGPHAAAAGPRDEAAGSEYLGEFQVTYYHVALEDARYEGLPRDVTLRDPDGCEIARVSAAFRRQLDLEGTGRLADGRVVNVSERRDDGWRYVDLGPAHWGLGVAWVPLLPFRSVAADPRWIRRGEHIYLPEFQGFPLPDGSPHGGRFIVDDIGSAIKRARLDIFIGDEQHLASFEAVVPSHAATPVYRVPAGWKASEPPGDLLLEARPETRDPTTKAGTHGVRLPVKPPRF